MKYVKINWYHQFNNEPNVIYSAVNDEGFEVKKIEIFEGNKFEVYSEQLNSDKLAIGLYPSLEELNFKESDEEMISFEITQEEFEDVWNKCQT